jgi:threonine dehydrogenase-like Zn-dependent dehydrogenase
MASTSEATIIPDEVPDEHAVFFSIAAIVMNGVRRSALAWGESAIVYGLGLLGQFAARFCEIAGARRVFAVDVAENRLAMLPRSPAIVPVNPSDTDIRALVRDHNHGRLVEVAFEVTGDPALIPGEFAALRRQGRMVILSSPRGPTPMFDFHNLSNAPSYTIIGAHVTSHPEIESPANQWTQIRHFDLFFDYLCETRIDVAPLISGIVPYAKAPETYAALLENRIPSMGIIFDWRG